MTMLDKKVVWSAKIMVLLAVFLGGCAPVGEQVDQPKAKVEKDQPATIALKFAVGDTTIYKVVTESKKSARFEGSLADKAGFKSGSTGNKVEMTFSRQIESVDDAGNAVVKITIKSLKYSAIVKDEVKLDFDSTDVSKNKHSLSKLIGQSYTIQLSPSGEFLRLVDAKDALAAVGRANNIAKNLIGNKAVKLRHGTIVLPSADKNKLRKGESWSDSKEFTFGMLGGKSYQIVYTLKEITDKDGRKVASIEMETTPGSDAETFQKEQTEAFSKMFDSTDTYTGQLELNLTDGKIEKYSEQMKSEWVVVDPKRGEENPDMIIMGAVRSYSIERVD